MGLPGIAFMSNVLNSQSLVTSPEGKFCMATECVNHVLFVDDDSDDYHIFLETAKEINPGVNVDYANDGEAISEFLNQHMYDLIILDFNMPKVDGIKCLKQIRADKKFENVPVVFQSVYYDKVLEAHQYGANFFIQKQYTFNKMKECIAAIMKRDWKDKEIFGAFEVIYSK